MSLQSIYILRYGGGADETTFRQKITAAVALAAIEVFREAEGVNGHRRRKEWAEKILIDRTATEQAAERMMWAAIAHPTLASGTAATDADIQTVVNALVNVFAGV